MSISNDSLLIAIVNYRTPELTIACLDSLQQEVQTLSQSLIQITVVVVDNASGDGSVAKIQTAIDGHGWQDWVSVLASESNGGFAYGNNLVIRPALASSNPPTYFLLLNPDTLTKPNTLKALIDFMNTHPQAGIAGGNVEDSNGKPWSSAFRFPTMISEFDSGLRLGLVSKLLSSWKVVRPMGEQSDQVDWLTGACLIIRKEVFESIGLLDEEYFLYYEETDFCLRAKRAGWNCWYVPECKYIHLVGQSSGLTREKPQQRKPQYWFNSRRRYFLKNHGLLYGFLTDLFWILGLSLWEIRSRIQNQPHNSPPQFLSDSIRNSAFFFNFNGDRK